MHRVDTPGVPDDRLGGDPWFGALSAASPSLQMSTCYAHCTRSGTVGAACKKATPAWLFRRFRASCRPRRVWPTCGKLKPVWVFGTSENPCWRGFFARPAIGSSRCGFSDVPAHARRTRVRTVLTSPPTRIGACWERSSLRRGAPGAQTGVAHAHGVAELVGAELVGAQLVGGDA